MMLDARDLSDGSRLVADVCIVGAGAAGISMALEFIDSGIDVLLLESGGMGDEAETQALYEGSVADAHLHSPPVRYRQRRFGGSTTIWGGRCVPFDAIDFETRDWIAHSGWPLTAQMLRPFYTRANRLCEAGDFGYTVEEAFATPPRAMLEGFSSQHFTQNSLERFSCPTNFAARYGHRLTAAKNLRVMLHANVTSLNLAHEDDRIASLTVRTLNGKGCTVEAARYVLATGGIEVARLLLASRGRKAEGIGNAHDQVGRYYMCHVAGTIGVLHLAGSAPAVWHGYDLSDEGIYCRRRLALTAQAQRQLRVGNFIARLHHPRIADPGHRTGILSMLYLAKGFISYEYGKRLHGGEEFSARTWLGHLRNLLLDPFGIARFLWHWLRFRILAARKFPSVIIRSRSNSYSLDFHAEQEPNPDSRVTLTDELDALGMPKVHVEWRYTRGDVATVVRSLSQFAADVQSCGIGRFDYDPDEVEAEMTRYGAYGGHHIGTARMGENSRDSVVNADTRVHGVNNLYIAGSAVFPTSSQANPTLTLIALALRLADHLKSAQKPTPIAVSRKKSVPAQGGITA